MNFRTSFFVLTVCVSSVCFAAPRSVDATELDIAGIKLGMSVQEAVSAVSAKLGISKQSIEFDKYPSLNIITNSKEAKYFTAKTRGASVSVHFEPRVPYNPANKLAVSMVIYEQPWTPDNAAAIKEMALEKYGYPSNGTIGMVFEWCQQAHSNPGIGCSIESNQPKLSYHGTELKLTDPRYGQAVNDYRNKKNSSKPVF